MKFTFRHMDSNLTTYQQGHLVVARSSRSIMEKDNYIFCGIKKEN